MKKEDIKKVVANEFEKFTKLNPEGNGRVIVYAHKREAFLRILRMAFPDLRLRRSLSLATIDNFTDFIYIAQEEKEALFSKALAAIEKVTGEKIGLNDKFLPNLDSSSMEFFFDISKIHRVVVKVFKYEANYTSMKDCHTPRELCELLYRRGQF